MEKIKEEFVTKIQECINTIGHGYPPNPVVTALYNMKHLIQLDEPMSRAALGNCVRNVAYTVMTISEDMYDDVQELAKDLERLEEKEIRQQFIDLIGKDKVKFLEREYRVDYSRKNKTIYKRNEIEMGFLETDNKGDTVSFFHLYYNEDTQEFNCGNCIDNSKTRVHGTYEEVKEHNLEIRDRILNNNFQFVDLP